MHLEVLDKMRIELLKKIVSEIENMPFYMAGGTALSLQFGFRKSEDLHFLVPVQFTPQILSDPLRKLAIHGCFEKNVDIPGIFDAALDEVHVSFIYYPEIMLNEYVDCPEIPGLKMAGPDDIAAIEGHDDREPWNKEGLF